MENFSQTKLKNSNFLCYADTKVNDQNALALFHYERSSRPSRDELLAAFSSCSAVLMLPLLVF